jgi:Sec-independent protein translocase protein TatA
MTAITIAIVVAIAAIVFGIWFIPGVGSAIAMGVGTAFFRVMAENRQKRIALRQERWRLFRRGRKSEPEPEPEPEPSKNTGPLVENSDEDTLEKRRERWRLFQRWRQRNRE